MLSSKAVRVGLKAKEIIRGTDEKPINAAVSSLESILNDSSFLRLDPEIQVDMLLVLSYGYERLERFTEQEQFLLDYAKKRELYRYSVLLKTALIRSYIRQDRVFEAEQLLSKLVQPSLAFASLEEKIEIAKTIVFVEKHLKSKLFSAEEAAEAGLLQESMNHYKAVLTSLEKFQFPFQASPIDKLFCKYSLRLRVAELYYLLGDFQHTATLLADWPEHLSCNRSMSPLYARHHALLDFTKSSQATTEKHLAKNDVEFIAWRASQAIEKEDREALNEQIKVLLEKENKELLPLVHTLTGFKDAFSQNMPAAFDELEKALSAPNKWTAPWRKASLDLFAQIGLQHALILALSHQEEKAAPIIKKLLQHGGNENNSSIMTSRIALTHWLEEEINSGTFHKTIAEASESPDEKLPDIFSSPALRMYLEALASYQQVVAGNEFEGNALNKLEKASSHLPAAAIHFLALRADLLIRGGLVNDACAIAATLIKEHPDYALTDSAVLLCLLGAEACPGFEKEALFFQEHLFSRPLTPQSLFLTFRLFETKREWPDSLSPLLKDLLFSLERREEARNFLVDAAKSKEAGFIKEQIEKADTAFSEAIEKARILIPIAQKDGKTVLWSLILLLHSEKLSSLTKAISSPFAYNELAEKITNEKDHFSHDIEICKALGENLSITASFLNECSILVSCTEFYILAFTENHDKLLPLSNTIPATILETSESACRAVFFAAKTFHASRRLDEALFLLSRLDESTIKDIHYELALEIALEKSLCLWEKKRPKKAMQLLAWIINSPCASSQRIKAMLVRADNYAVMHREELAIKQLEAVVEKGGEWGAVAERKLLEIRNIHGNSST